MKNKITILLSLFVFTFFSCEEQPDLLIKNASLFDGTGSDIKSSTNIVIHNGKIKEITDDSNINAKEVIDAEGKTLMPGLINSHLHLFWNMYDLPPEMPAKNDAEAKKFIEGELKARLRGHLENGITSILSPIDFWPYINDVKQKVENGEISGPNIFMAGPVLLNSGDYYACAGLTGEDLKWCNDKVRLPIDTPQQAIESVKKLAEYKVDVVVYDGVTNQVNWSKEVINAIVTEAHKHKLKVLVHNADAKNAKDMVLAGVDGFIHPPAGTKDIDGKLLSIIGEKKLPIAITLGFMQRYIGLGFATPKDKNDYDIMVNNVQVMLKAGAVPLFTSDMPGIPPAEVVPTVVGVMKGQGIDNKTILLSATREGAKVLGRNDIGTIEPGKKADIILIDGNPLQDINSLNKVKLVIKNGKVAVDKR